MIDEHDLHMEDQLFPWLADESMADQSSQSDFFDELNEFEDEEDIE